MTSACVSARQQLPGSTCLQALLASLKLAGRVSKNKKGNGFQFEIWLSVLCSLCPLLTFYLEAEGDGHCRSAMFNQTKDWCEHVGLIGGHSFGTEMCC